MLFAPSAVTIQTWSFGSGTLGDGFIGLDASFDDGSCAATCTSAYVVDVSYTVPVPEPATWALFGAGAALLALARRSHI